MLIEYRDVYWMLNTTMMLKIFCKEQVELQKINQKTVCRKEQTGKQNRKPKSPVKAICLKCQTRWSQKAMEGELCSARMLKCCYVQITQTRGHADQIFLFKCAEGGPWCGPRPEQAAAKRFKARPSPARPMSPIKAELGMEPGQTSAGTGV